MFLVVSQNNTSFLLRRNLDNAEIPWILRKILWGRWNYEWCL